MQQKYQKIMTEQHLFGKLLRWCFLKSDANSMFSGSEKVNILGWKKTPITGTNIMFYFKLELLRVKERTKTINVLIWNLKGDIIWRERGETSNNTECFRNSLWCDMSCCASPLTAWQCLIISCLGLCHLIKLCDTGMLPNEILLHQFSSFACDNLDSIHWGMMCKWWHFSWFLDLLNQLQTIQ